MKRIVLWLCAVLWCGGDDWLHARSAANVPVPAEEARCRQWVDSVLSGLSLQEKMGQLIVATFPAKADKQRKKQVRDWVKRYKIGGLLFTEGTPEEQALLTNLAQKSAKVPVLIAHDGSQGLSMPLDGAPRFPKHAALGCIGDNELIETYGREVAREFCALGIGVHLAPDVDAHADSPFPVIRAHTFSEDPKRAAGKIAACHRGLESGGILSVKEMGWIRCGNVNAVLEVLGSVKAGTLSEQEVEERCRRILAYKYWAGLRGAVPPLQVSGMSYRVHTDETKALVERLRKESVTVLGNHFGVLPLTPAGGASIALLSVGEGNDSTFVEEVKKLSPVPVECFRVTKVTPEETRREWARKLAGYRRVVVSMSGEEADVLTYSDFLMGLDLPAPLVYAFFTSYRSMQMLWPVLQKSSAVVLGHSAEADIQQYVAGVLFAKEPARGKLSMSIGALYAVGEGSVVEPGMEPGAVIPEDLGMKSYALHRIDGIVKEGLAAGAFPGCQVLVLKEGRTVYDRCFGTHSDKDSTAVRPTDLFDLSSLTNTTATLLAVMKLYDTGKLKLTDKISSHLPSLRSTNKRHMTVKDLLLHESGLPPYLRFYMEAIDPNSVHGPYAQSWVDKWHRTQVSEHSYYCSDFRFKKGLVSERKSSTYSLPVADKMWMNKSFKHTILQGIARCEVGAKRYVRSDLGFILLQQVVEAVSGLPMELYVAKEFYAPMGLQRTLFLPLQKYSKEEIMPTAANDFLRRQDLHGYVHDEAAACMGGIAGHAGLFSTASEVAKIHQMLLNGGELNGKRYLSEATCRLFTTETSVISRRGLGFDRPDVGVPKRSPCTVKAPASVYGHTGFTGTAAWADPTNDVVYVFLSNRLCPKVWNTQLGDLKIRTRIQEAIYDSLSPNILP